MRRRAAALVALATVLTACTAQPAPSPTPSAPDPAAQARDVLARVQRQTPDGRVVMVVLDVDRANDQPTQLTGIEAVTPEDQRHISWGWAPGHDLKAEEGRPPTTYRSDQHVAFDRIDVDDLLRRAGEAAPRCPQGRARAAAVALGDDHLAVTIGCTADSSVQSVLLDGKTVTLPRPDGDHTAQVRDAIVQLSTLTGSASLRRVSYQGRDGKLSVHVMAGDGRLKSATGGSCVTYAMLSPDTVSGLLTTCVHDYDSWQPFDRALVRPEVVTAILKTAKVDTAGEWELTAAVLLGRMQWELKTGSTHAGYYDANGKRTDR